MACHNVKKELVPFRATREMRNPPVKLDGNFLKPTRKKDKWCLTV